MPSYHQWGSSEAFMIGASAGRVPGVSVVTITGRNRNVSAGATPEPLSEEGLVGRAAFLAAAETLEVVSTSADDNPAGSGAAVVLVQGLDAAGLEIQETVLLNGLTPVTLTQTYWRVNAMLTVGVGATSTARVNAGDITLTSQTTATPMRLIFAGEGLDHSFVYTVPTDQQIIFGNFFISLHTPNNSSTDKSACSVSFVRTLPNGGPFIRIATWSQVRDGPSVVLWPNPHPNPLTGGSDLIFEVDSASQGGDTDVSSGLNVYKSATWEAVI